MKADPLLMTPGPTRIPERVLLAGHRVLHHRTPEFSAVLEEVLERLRPLFGAADPSRDVLPVHATGRATMEAAVLNFLSPGDTLVACCNGKFGEMWARLAESYGVRVERVCTAWEESVDLGALSETLEATPGAKAVTVVHSDSSTGVLNPVDQVAALAHDYGATVWVDGISAVGGVPFESDGWDLDFAVTSSQKCLMSSPGLSFAMVGPRARALGEASSFTKNYLSFDAIRETLAGSRPETPGTTPVALVLQVLEAARMVHEEGLAAVFARHREMAASVREAALGVGCGLYGDGIEERSPTLSALRLPEGVDPSAVRASLRRQGILIAGGLGDPSDRCVRIGHMGDIRPADVERTMEAFEAAVVAF